MNPCYFHEVTIVEVGSNPPPEGFVVYWANVLLDAKDPLTGKTFGQLRVAVPLRDATTVAEAFAGLAGAEREAERGAEREMAQQAVKQAGRLVGPNGQALPRMA